MLVMLSFWRYLDPQYFLRRHLSTSSDVYSFGIVLLVLITGKKAIDCNRADELTLVEWVKIKFQEGDLKSIADPLLADDFLPEDFRTVTELALKCAAFERFERPSMKVRCATYIGAFGKENDLFQREKH
eukprot:Gb_08920 [translate_table: standard]